MICELLFPSSILAVKMNRKTLVIVLEVEDALRVRDDRGCIRRNEESDGLRKTVFEHERARLRAKHARASRRNEETASAGGRGSNCGESVRMH